MAVFVSCPDCGRPLRVPDELLGRKVRCPQCKVMFVASTAESGGAAVATDRTPRGRRGGPAGGFGDPARRELRRQWGRVRIGLTLNLIGTWVWVAGYAFFIIGLVMGLVLGTSVLRVQLGGNVHFAAGTGDAVLLVVGLCTGLYALTALLEVLLRTIGCGLCIGVPLRRDTLARALAITACVLSCAGAGVSLVGTLVGLTHGTDRATSLEALRQPAAHVPQLAGMVLGSAGFFVFLLCARSMAKELHNVELVGGWRRVITGFATWYGLVLFGSGGLVLTAYLKAAQVGAGSGSDSAEAALVPKVLATMGAIVALLLVFLLEALVIWYGRTLRRLRDATRYGDT
jgi:hypothetical protein